MILTVNQGHSGVRTKKLCASHVAKLSIDLTERGMVLRLFFLFFFWSNEFHIGFVSSGQYHREGSLFILIC